MPKQIKIHKIFRQICEIEDGFVAVLHKIERNYEGKIIDSYNIWDSLTLSYIKAPTLDGAFQKFKESRGIEE